jgi:perosamine synthetase
MIGPIKPFKSIGIEEMMEVAEVMSSPLSGYLAGQERGGARVRALEDAWARTFKVKHAIACNSATSGLMAAAFAVGLRSGDQFICPAMTMSATCAAPMFTGATPIFCDVRDDDFAAFSTGYPPPKANFVTNLFGHPAKLRNLRDIADMYGTYLIEDNAQSPFAMTDMLSESRYTGTIGYIGVFSLNVHKPIQCGEGGVVTTDDDDLAKRLRNFINHGENAGDRIGLNLRMPEVCAAIALVQLRRGPEIIAGRVKQAEAILAAIRDIPGIRPPITREGCTHVYYAIPFLIETKRAAFCAALREQGVPIVEGYVPPLYRLPAFSAFARSCPVAEDLHDWRLFYFENCAYDPTPEQMEQIGDAFQKAAKAL